MVTNSSRGGFLTGDGLSSNPKTALRSGQIVGAAFLAGVLIFMGVVIAMTLMKSGQGAAPASAATSASAARPILVYLAIGCVVVFGLVAMAVRTILVRAARGQWAQRSDDDTAISGLVQRFAHMGIFRMAMLEGAALIATVSLLVEGAWLACAPWAVAVVGMILLFPTSKRLEKFLADVTGRDAGAA
jgi:hypothetical protein